jgi:hypothetical protein
MSGREKGTGSSPTVFWALTPTQANAHQIMIQYLIGPKIRFFGFLNLSKVGSRPENTKNCPFVPL